MPDGALGKPVVLVLGPQRAALSGVSAHVNTLLTSPLADAFALFHFQVGSEGRHEGAAGRLLRLLASPFALALTIAGRGAAIVHLNTSLNARAFWRDCVYLLVARACGARVLLQVHGGALPRDFCGGRAWRAAIVRAALRLADAVVVLARCELEAYRAFVADQYVVAIPNAVDGAPFAALAQRPAESRSTLRLAYMGRLARGKGLDELLLGIELARAQGTRARLAIAGSGPEEPRLRRLAERYGLRDDVVFVGPVRGDRKLALLAAADVAVLPSYSEGLPVALLEGMAAGLPVIATPVGGIPDVVTDGVHGVLIAPRDAQAIARAIAQLAADRRLLARMGAAARARVTGAYSVPQFAARFGRLYAELCVGKRLRRAAGA
jgi:glycosyltransferase involved in cell wall biosynthesis